MKTLGSLIKNQKAKFVKWHIKQRYTGDLAIQIINKKTAISLEQSYCYTRIPKAANSTVIANLYNCEKNIILNTTEEVQDIKDNYYSTLNDMSYGQYVKLESFFKFTLVRHPVSRIISAYLDKVVKYEAPQRRLVLKALNKKSSESISFDEFLHYLSNGGINENAHWARQKDLLFFNHDAYDYIGKIETITTDLPIILKSIYGNYQEIISLRPHASGLSKDYSVDLNQLNIIEDLYQADFKIFNY